MLLTLVNAVEIASTVALHLGSLSGKTPSPLLFLPLSSAHYGITGAEWKGGAFDSGSKAKRLALFPLVHSAVASAAQAIDTQFCLKYHASVMSLSAPLGNPQSRPV